MAVRNELGDTIWLVFTTEMGAPQAAYEVPTGTTAIAFTGPPGWRGLATAYVEGCVVVAEAAVGGSATTMLDLTGHTVRIGAGADLSGIDRQLTPLPGIPC